MQSIRAFIALEISAQIQEQLGRIQDQLKEADADVKWVKPEGIHLTLKFLGNVSLELIEEIKEALEQLAKAHQRFELQISHLGAFPKVEHPRVIWVGTTQGKEKASQLAADLEERLINLGFMREKRAFKSHLTIGRVRSSRNREQLKTLLQSTTCSPQTMPAEKIVLFKSTLTPQGAIYEVLHQVKLIH